MKRRDFVAALSAAGISAALLLKPTNNGSAYSGYFASLNNTLKKSGLYRPMLLLDLNALDDNIFGIKQSINPKNNYRIVTKSLPSAPLLSYIMGKTNTNKLMVFHQPFLNHIANTFPNADVLLGKPLPVKSAALFYRSLQHHCTFKAHQQLQWLVDTPLRLAQYRQLAATLGVKLRINIELDVGLHRGGLQSLQQLQSMMDIIQANPGRLEFSGFMGYDAHIAKLPAVLKIAERAFAQSQALYRQYVTWLRQRYPDIRIDSLCLNGAGSLTMLLHKHNSVINDVAAGSCLVKPTTYDIPSLKAFRNASYIASPVLKKTSGMLLPSIESLRHIAPLWDPNLQQTYFIYGGQWLADYESPAGLADNALFGVSSNQAMVNGSTATGLNVDDHIFFRPRQSESVFLQFGEILAYRDNGELMQWPVLAQSV